MSLTICFKCGSAKPGALVACRTCNAAPTTNSQYAVSLALSDHLSSKDQLAHYSHELRNGKKLSVPREALVQALNALKDPQLLAMLGAQPQPATPTPALLPPAATRQPPPVPPAASQRVAPPPPPIKQEPRLTTTALHQSAFAVLGVTTRDNRKRIVELAEEKSLELDHDVCQKARSDLTNPRTRSSAEIAWLPGVSPRKATQLIENLLNDPMAIRGESGLPTLAHLNLLAAAFEAVDGKHEADDLAEFIMEAAYLAEELTPGDVLRDINEDRAVSGFPEVRALDQIEAELAERKRYYRGAIKDALDRLPPMTLIQVMTETVDGVTSGGEDHAPGLIDDLVDSYEVETHGILQKEAENVHKLIKAARDHAGSGEAAVKPYVDKLDAVARNWDKIAQPIQLSSKARGIDHEASRDLANQIHGLAIDLFIKHDMLAQSQRLTGLLQELFSEVPEVSERVERDADALEDIASDRNILAKKFKDFNLSGNTFSWKGLAYDINAIKHIGFYRAITTHKTNFMETGKTEKAILMLTFNSGQTLDISIDEKGIFFNKNRTQQIGTLADFYGFLLRVTFERRVKFYEEQIERNGYFVYDECYVYPHKKVVFRGRDFDVNTSSFLRSYGCIEMRMKDYGVFDKIKREASRAKVSQFNTLTDTDVIFYLLDKHMGLRWKS